MKKTHVIIGTSAAAIGCINKLRALDPGSEIICISAELEFPYNKCFLVDYWAGDKAEEQIATKKPEFFEQNNIRLMLGKRVVKIVPYPSIQLLRNHSGRTEQRETVRGECFSRLEEKNVSNHNGYKSESSHIVLNDGQQLSFDTLLIATGSRARKFTIPGFLRQAPLFAKAYVYAEATPHTSTGKQDERGEGVFYFHTLNDTHRIMHYIQKNNPRNAVVIGSGFTGLEVADALTQKGIETKVVERGSRVLSSFLSEKESAIIQDAMNQKGVEFIGDKEVEEIGSNAVTLNNGETIPADLIIIAIGVVPNSELAQEAGIELYSGGIETNLYLQTNIPNIYAAGDVATVKDQLSGEPVRSCMWADAMQQGMIAAHGMAGIKKDYPGVMTTGISSFFGLDIMVSGSDKAEGEDYVCQTERSYRKYIVKEGTLQSFIMIGKLEKVGVARRALMTQIPVDMSELE